MTDDAGGALLAEADDLFALAPADFTAARDARAKALKADDADLSAAVKKLKKPSVAAWVVNLLVRRETEQVEQVLATGEALRQAQSAMSADELRALTRQRRQLTAAVTTRARALAREEGVKVTGSVGDQVEATLTAAMVDEECGRAVRSGLLVASLAATGVDEVDVAAAVALPEALGFEATARGAEDEAEPGPPSLRVVPDPDADAKALAAAQEALDEATSRLDEATEEHEQAESEVQELSARALELRSQLDELARKVAELEQSAEETDDELGDAEEVRDEAAETLAEAQRERDDAAAEVERLGG